MIANLIILSILIISLSGCSNDNEEISKDKIESELRFLDIKLITLFNSVNGISIENYIVQAEQVKENSAKKTSKSSSSSTSSQEESGSSSDNSSSSEGGESGSEGEGTDSESGGTSGDNNINYRMEENQILLQGRTPDWKVAKSEIEKLYSTWSTIAIDLYKVNVNSQDVLTFNSDLDTATQAIKNEDSAKSLTSIAKLYSYIPKYIGAVTNQMKTINLYKTKSNILNAYAAVEQNNYELVKTELSNAEQSFLPIINDISSNANNQSNINKVYILIKELQNSMNNKDKDIFYIKYKNLIQEIENIK